MADPQYKDEIAEIARDQVRYDATDLRKLSFEQAIRLLQLHRMHVSEGEMKTKAKKLKEGHKEVQELHKLLGLINKLTNQKEGPDRGTLSTTHPDFKDEIKGYIDLARLIKSHTKRVKDENSKEEKDVLDLTDPKAQGIRELARTLGIELSDSYEGEDYDDLQTRIRDLAGISENEDWNKLQDLQALNKALKRATEHFKIELNIKEDGKYTKEERDALITAIDTAAKDRGLQNDMDMQDLNRAYQERLEILQMARGIVKTLHDDKVHKARSSGSR